ncbi:histidine utilization repressor [Rhizobacter sp. AJA081-3]|uniref:histidine utilization repressor n=1 Tax=Rhizobacter sp. AJA081-3 TaxID=2753607 RepID=UPI001AE02AEA|nr:histidine utilization repressor [Rhizobacter sp. AJA081-3]QTN23152.1 histidine utilization repressor [Rhizobacter sp. AJA081-3]
MTKLAVPRRLPSEEVKDSIRQRIAEGGWQPGMKLPSERELVQQFGCARMTVHHALRELEDEGLIERRQGSGSYVAQLHPISNVLQVRDIRDEIAERRHVHATRVCGVQREKAGADIAAAMRLRKGAVVFHVRLVHLENGVPIQLEDRHVNPALAPDFMTLDFTQVTPSHVLFQHAPLTEAEQVVEAVLADAEQAKWLDIAEGSALLMVSRRTVSQGAVASVARLYHPGSRYRLIGRFSV